MTEPSNTAIVSLSYPLKRGTTSLDTITLRKPRVADLRGLALSEVMQLKTDAVAVLLTRISEPQLTRHEVDSLDILDFGTLAGEVIGFFLSPEAMDSLTT
ncbi:phage tail assembly protein [Ottowia sp.]|uniref:phage tail assembly protein n=1 Tax=Ottowia sp. TaxID=1898956 RepID=UPI002609E219|nr:phage tail assembly protein [Ottowia sp.]